ncbi:MAG: hypothetical protein ABW046_07130 [Actinoplanes sp.]
MSINWDAISDRFAQAQIQLYDEGYRGGGYAEALRRTFGYRDTGEQRDGERAVPYEHLRSGQGLVTDAEATYVRDSHTFADRHNLERAEQQIKELRAELRRVYAEAGKDLAELLRERCNEQTVPSKYRRDGVAWAADLIDPTVRKDRFGNVVRSEPPVGDAA